MNRRDFIAGAATGAVVSAAATYGATRVLDGTVPPAPVPAPTPAAPAVVKQVRELRMVTSWPPNFPGLSTAAQKTAERITALSDGTLNVTVFAGGELVPALDAFDAVADGRADMYHGAESYWRSKSPAFNFFSTVPGGLLAPEMNAWIYHGGGQALWDELSGGFGVKPLLCGNTGVQMGGWFAREIGSVADLDGLKMCIPGLGAEVMRRLGVAVQDIDSSGIFPALQQGTIDAAVWFGPWNDFAFGFHKIAKQYYWPGFHEPGTALALGINKDVWDSLTRTQQAMVVTAAATENGVVYAEFMARNAEALQTMVKAHGVQLRRFPDDVLQAAGQAVAEAVGALGDSDPLTKKVFEAYLAFRRNIAEWTALSEQGYANARSTFFS